LIFKVITLYIFFLLTIPRTIFRLSSEADPKYPHRDWPINTTLMTMPERGLVVYCLLNEEMAQVPECAHRCRHI